MSTYCQVSSIANLLPPINPFQGHADHRNAAHKRRHNKNPASAKLRKQRNVQLPKAEFRTAYIPFILSQVNRMVKEHFDEEDALVRFDKLAGLGIIAYGPSRAVPLTDAGFRFEFRICPTWSKKPLGVGDALKLHDDLPEPEKFGPGSDIFRSHPDQVVKTIKDTHTLALNIFPVFRPQYLLLTLDTFRSQDEHLTIKDIDAAWSFLQSTKTPHFAMYNCTKDAGCSRYHKHMQILRKPEACDSEFRFFPDVRNLTASIPYVYFINRFPVDAATDGKAILAVYLGLLKKCRKVLVMSEDDDKVPCPHNVVLDKGWIVVIPRQSGNFKGIGANAAGMMGMPTISNSMLFKRWTDIGPARVLCELGVPNRDLNNEEVETAG